MDDNSNDMMSICCGKCLITVTRRKTVSNVGWCLISVCAVGFISCLIVTGLKNKITSDIDSRLDNLNETGLGDFDLQTTETLLVRIRYFH